MKTKRAFLGFFIAAAAMAVVLRIPHAIRAVNEGRDVPVLMYHGFADDPGNDVWTVSSFEFERQMRELKDGGRTAITPNQLALAAKGLFLLPAKPVVITMDDGFQDNVTIAEPIMRKYGMKGICYLIMSHIGDSPGTRSQYRGRDNLVWPEVREAIGRGTLSFGSHSISHSANAELQSREVASSRHLFHGKTGFKANAYCYPNGYAPDLIWEAVRHKHRFTTAMICTDTVFRFSCDADLYRIPRVSIYGGAHDFALDMVEWKNGGLSARATNRGAPMPVRCLLRDRRTGRSFLSDGPPQRLAQGNSRRFAWKALPSDLPDDSLEVIVSEQNGLFTYGAPASVPPRDSLLR